MELVDHKVLTDVTDVSQSGGVVCDGVGGAIEEEEAGGGTAVRMDTVLRSSTCVGSLWSCHGDVEFSRPGDGTVLLSWKPGWLSASS